MKYFVKAGKNNRAEMLLTQKHSLINGFVEVEISQAQFDEISKNLGRYEVKFIGNNAVLEYVPKNEEEVVAEEKMEYNSLMKSLRRLREEECFSVINRGYLWYKQLTDEQLNELEIWYKNWLDVTETYVMPEKLSFI